MTHLGGGLAPPCLHKRNFFRMVPKGLNAFGSFVHAAESAS